MSQILTPSGKIITPDSLFIRHRFARNNCDIDSPAVQMEGFFKFIVRRADGSIKQETPFGRNLILNAGLNDWAAVGNLYTGFCAIGTGTTAANVAQSGLIAQSAFTTVVNDFATASSGATPWWFSSTHTWRFSIGQLNGNYTEVGVGKTQPNLFSRALITPDGVNPTAISVQSDEQLDVVYQLRAYPPLSDVSGDITLAGQNYAYVGRAALVNSPGSNSFGYVALLAGYAFGAQVARNEFGISSYASTDVLAAITDAPSQNVAGTVTGSTGSYSSGTYTLTGSATFGLNDGNAGGGIKSVCVFSGRLGSYQYGFTPNIPKDATKTLRLDFQNTWARRP